MPVTNLLKINKVLGADHPLVTHRRMICLKCPHRTVGRVLGLIPGEKGAQCVLCSCIIVLKTRCPDETCEDRRW